MFDGSGLKFAKKLIAESRNLIGFLISGYIDGKTEVSRIAEKEFEFFEKPYNDQELLRKVRETLA